MGDVIDLHDWVHRTTCRCKPATLRAFRELRKREEPLQVALEAASIVYRYHHPDVSEDLALQTVVGWLLETDGGAK